MKAITLRGIPEPVAKRIEERANRKGMSLNKTVIEMLSEQAGTAEQAVYHDLDHLVGTWTQEEADEFERELKAQRTIDETLWR